MVQRHALLALRRCGKRESRGSLLTQIANTQSMPLQERGLRCMSQCTRRQLVHEWRGAPDARSCPSLGLPSPSEIRYTVPPYSKRAPQPWQRPSVETHTLPVEPNPSNLKHGLSSIHVISEESLVQVRIHDKRFEASAVLESWSACVRHDNEAATSNLFRTRPLPTRRVND